MTRQTLHIRLPQRADAVEGEAQQPSEAAPVKVIPAPRTASQDTVLKTGKLSKAENGIIAELDQGPLGA